MEAHRHPLGRNPLPDQILRGDAHPQQRQLPGRDEQAIAVGSALDHALDADQPFAAARQCADLAAQIGGDRRQPGARRRIELGDSDGEAEFGAVEPRQLDFACRHRRAGPQPLRASASTRAMARSRSTARTQPSTARMAAMQQRSRQQRNCSGLHEGEGAAHEHVAAGVRRRCLPPWLEPQPTVVAAAAPSGEAFRVVAQPLLRIAQRLVGLQQQLEGLLASGTAAPIRMEALGPPAKSGL